MTGAEMLKKKTANDNATIIAFGHGMRIVVEECEPANNVVMYTTENTVEFRLGSTGDE